MSNKAVIGGVVTVDTERADSADRLAANRAAEVAMIKRRIRTFFDALTEVRFPADAPSWAPDWREWLLTGEVVMAEEPVEETLGEEPAGPPAA
jgi:hypothetical protein